MKKAKTIPLFFIFLNLFFNCQSEDITEETLTETNTPPTITNIAPSSGIEGEIITIEGMYFGEDISKISFSFNDIEAHIKSLTKTEAQVLIPKDAKKGKITVTTDNGSYTYSEFTVLEAPLKEKVDVFAVGSIFESINHKPYYWKNGEAMSLPTVDDNGSIAFGIQFIHDDVYIVGSKALGDITSYSESTAVLWKNGGATLLPDLGRNTNVSATSVINENDDIYILGKEIDFKTFNSNILYWKNETLHVVTDGSKSKTEAHEIFFIDNDLYIVGTESPKSSGLFTAETGFKTKIKYWINGEGKDITDGTTLSEITSVTTYNKDIYIGGYIETSVSGNRTPTYWKNGEAVSFSGFNGEIRQIAVSKGDVHLIIYDYDTFKYLYYKNGKEELKIEDANITSMKVINDAVYMVYEDISSEATAITKVKYWKNGKFFEIPSHGGTVYAMLVN